MRYGSLMDRIVLTHLPVVLAVAGTRSFARAAADLGLSPSAASHAVRIVEERLGVPLFARTTRSVALTEAGTTFLEGAQRAMDALDGATERVRKAQSEVSGLLRINAPRLALHIGFTPILAEMTRRHPKLTVEVIADDALTDVIAEGFDMGVRLGNMIAQDLVAVRLTPPMRAIMVAAPVYLTRFGSPDCVGDLKRHNCIGFRLLSSGAVYQWDVQEAGKDLQVDVSGTVRVSDPAYARELALAGLGIAYVMEPLVRSHLENGLLTEVIPEAAIWEPGLFLYFPKAASRAAKIRAFLDVVRETNVGGRGNPHSEAASFSP